MKFKRYIKFVATLLLLCVFLGGNIAMGANGFPEAVPSGPTLPTSAQTGLSDRSFAQILTGVLVWLLGIVGIVALISFIISGVMYLLAAGDEKLADKGKNGMTYSVIGITIILGAYVIIQAIEFALNGSRP